MDTDRTALALAGLCATAGVMHVVKPEPFDGLIPESLPGSKRAWTYGSGVVELATAGLLACPATRRAGGAMAAALFVGVFPGNVQMAWNWRDRSWPWQILSVGRLPLQFPLIRDAVRVARSEG